MFDYFCAASATNWVITDSVKWTNIIRSSSDAAKSYCKNANTDPLGV